MPVSSRKTRRVGSQVGAAACHTTRAAATSGRSGSEGRTVLFLTVRPDRRPRERVLRAGARLRDQRGQQVLPRGRGVGDAAFRSRVLHRNVRGEAAFSERIGGPLHWGEAQASNQLSRSSRGSRGGRTALTEVVDADPREPASDDEPSLSCGSGSSRSRRSGGGAGLCVGL